ncbi:MAG TPA: hypothetical protein VGC54_08685 [Planctomycetota bacterium]
MRWFFVCMASLLLVIVAVGFAPSFYLPSAYGEGQAEAGRPPVPAYIVLHGIALTLWFLLLLAQALLVATRRVRIHRTLGIAGVLLAVAFVPLSLLVVTRSVARSNLGVLPVIGDFGILTLFAVLVTVAIRMRRRVHPATGWGVLAFVVVLGVAVPLGMSELGQRLVESLE